MFSSGRNRGNARGEAGTAQAWPDRRDNYLRQRRQEEILEQLNRVYGGQPDRGERRTTARMKARFRRTIEEHW